MTIAQQTSTKQDILQHLLKQGQATAQELAQALDISPQASRRHLKELGGEGLVKHQSVRSGMGRPQHTYQLTRQGRDHLPSYYSEFAVSFLDALAETGGEEQVSAVLRKQWERKAVEYRKFMGEGSLQERVANLVQLRQQEGYMAEWSPVEAGEAQQKFFLAEHNCAISEVAESYPSVCGQELEMFAAVLPDCTVERTHWLNNGEHRCGYLIEAKSIPKSDL
ncbi:MAG: iron-sulfur cluster biosynthesis transcriptional regulator SufR [Cyanobacteria bacterium QH_8_48_120]|jgi:DeoR family suf operon transcriptional repressor|nr:MAG: iron-sulfur cluster biosynthesis transcriptional regulator SufR [Cyanobacteria bacterium QH_1_48_107]PSO56706.1 MAG: iron-sulfur cluster biosynthesis transcriptional regulator SufR [Cyanobacteria bacterium QH_7_48_89]PSO60077.1 MAG: iron-sulfur cluster biosynthesis transcriptional regulator SufR [Cyanobacteria bacterium QH_10_48_56]PSO63879.1 MAG: iron-sulfur cluster biosynthesis transcriptional regulator SufR [Cyanobacteria bacterium QH_6_48_35]PSO66435.1 MAG: iron-sulfur cluster biosy